LFSSSGLNSFCLILGETYKHITIYKFGVYTEK
jgi:hypothetical protein